MNLSQQAARRLRPEGAFHLPPTAQPISAEVDLIVADSEYQPEVYLTDTRRDLSWHVMLEADAAPGTWRARVKLPREVTIVTYFFQFHAPTPVPLLQERRQIEGRNTAIYGEWSEAPFKIAVYDPAHMPADWTQGIVMYQIFPDRFANGDPSNDHLMKGVYGHAPKLLPWGAPPEHPPLGRDFFGGDLRGVIQKLDYIAELGVDLIYFTPIFDAPTNHRYDAIDYFKIDPMLGTLDDFRELIREAHARDLKVMLDAVFNHCSSDSVYFDITNKFGSGAYSSKTSPYYRWFDFQEHPTKYRGWIGLGFMPEFVECPEVEEFFCGENGVTAYWLQEGIDGWRCDVAFDNSDEFWRRFRRRVEKTKRGAYTVSELWIDSTHYLLGDTFNATMNYRFAWAARGFLAEDKLTPTELDDRLMTWQRDTPPPALKAQMNLVDSHDTDRILHVCRGDLRRVKQVLAFQLSYPGAPMIYYGGETGLDGAYAEDGRRCMPWDNLDHALIGYYKHAISARRDLPALRYGDARAVVIDDEQRLYVFAREYQGETIYCAFNASDAAADVAIRVGGGAWRDALNDTPCAVSGDQLTATIPARSCAWFVKL